MGKLREELKSYYKWKDIPGDFGIEIEAETKSKSNYPDNFIEETFDQETEEFYMVAPSLPKWTIHKDDSLRNYGLEYVLKEPLKYDAALAALDEFEKSTAGIPFIENSPSTSVHVHVNMTNELPVTMANFLTTYLLYENVLIEFSGELRRSNLFALPTRVAEATAHNVAELFEKFSRGESYALSYSAESVKYAALNLACLQSLGSLEVRSFRGTADVSQIKPWLGIINRILIYARTEGLTPKGILRAYRDHDMELFGDIFGVFGGMLRKGIPDDEFVRMVDKNLWFAKEIADSVADWNAINTVYSLKPKPEKKKGLSAKQLVIDEYEEITPLTQVASIYATQPQPFQTNPWLTTNNALAPAQPYPLIVDDAPMLTDEQLQELFAGEEDE